MRSRSPTIGQCNSAVQDLRRDGRPDQPAPVADQHVLPDAEHSDLHARRRLLEDKPQGDPWWLLLPLVVAFGECYAWFYLVRSYRLLNTAKYAVVGALEERLPASPYWRAEWHALGEGRDRSKYWPLTHIEKWIPTLFAAAAVAVAVAQPYRWSSSRVSSDLSMRPAFHRSCCMPNSPVETDDHARRTAAKRS